MKENRKNADLFAVWYIENRQYLINVLRRTYPFDEDILSNVFISIYQRMLYQDITLKDCTPYMLRAYKYAYLKSRKKAARMMLIEDYNQLQNIYSYEIH